MKRQYLEVPINIYVGKVEITGEDKIHPLHPLILELATTVHDLEIVSTAFGLDPKLVQEAIIDLMYKELVYVDLLNSRIYPNPKVETAVDQGRLDRFLGLQYPEVKVIRWCQDLSTGQIFMFEDCHDFFRRPLDLTDNNKYSLKYQEYPKIHHITPQTLLKIGKMVLRTYIPKGDIFNNVKRIQSLNLDDSRRLYIPLLETTFPGSSTKILVPQTHSLPSLVVESWMKSLTDVDAYQINDLSPISDDYILHFSWFTLLRRWNDFLSIVGMVIKEKFTGPDIKIRLKQSLAFLKEEGLETLVPIMSDLYMSVCEIQVQFFKGKDVLTSIEEYLKKAKHLVIIGSSFISSEGMYSIYPALEECYTRGVKVIVIWGGLGEPIKSLNRNFPLFQMEGFSFVEAQEKFHSKFIIIGDNSAWLSSCNFLSYWYDDSSPREIFCELTGGRIIGEIIEHARTFVRRAKEETQWIDHFYVKESKSQDLLLDRSMKMGRFKDTLEELVERIQEFISDLANHELKTNFEMTYNQLRDQLKHFRTHEAAVLIHNLEHRRFLRSVLESSKKTVKIGTDNININAVSTVLATALNECSNRNVSISIQWGRLNPTFLSREQEEWYNQLIGEFESLVGAALQISRLPSHSHAKYLTMDEQLCLVTSYNLLAFAGNGLADDDITDELGVIISSKRLAKNIDSNLMN